MPVIARAVFGGSVTVSPPDTDDGRCSAGVNDQHARGREAEEPKPAVNVDTMGKHHPGQKVKSKEISGREQRWIDIGSGIMSRTFVNADRLHTTSKGGPSMMDI